MKRKLQIALLLLSVFASKTLIAQNRTQAINTASGVQTMNSSLEQLASSSVQSQSLPQLYLAVSGSVDKIAFAKKGINICGNPQATIFIATFDRALTLAELQQLNITSWAVRNSNDKINPLTAAYFQENGNAEVKLLIEVAPNVEKAVLQTALSTIGISLPVEQTWIAYGTWMIKATAAQLANLASLKEVISVTPEMEAKPLVNRALGLTNTSRAHLPTALGGYGLDGSGVCIGVGDDSDPNHVDYIDRILSFNPQWRTDHGFFTTGIASSNGIKDQRYKGFANRATVISDYFSQVIANGRVYAQDFNMVASNNSYGNILGSCNYSGTYDIYSVFLDELAIDKPGLLNIFAAANDGGINCSPFPVGYATITGSYSTAKNVLTVGALSSRPQNYWESIFSSKGPVKDGRLKPEITAMGAEIFAHTENNEYVWASGTSSSTPNVTGATALLVQRYKQLNSGLSPKGGLVKNILMNGATDIGNAGPDFMHGFGMLNTARSLKIIDENRFFTNTINTNNEQTYSFTIPANVSVAKILLYWHDPAAAALSTQTLINNLDLSVTAPNNTVTLPLILNSAPSQVLNLAVPGVDTVNNVEQVVLNNPTPGFYTIKVRGQNVTIPNQEYFVSYDFVNTGTTIEYPVGGESLAAGDSMIVYWEASEGSNTFTVSYSTTNGGTWEVLSANIDAALRNYTFQLPANTVSNQCLVRVTRNNTTQTSQSLPFTVAARPIASLALPVEQCPGSVKLLWTPAPGVSSYRIFRKIGIDMVAVGTTNDTFFTLAGLSVDSTYWLAVSPIVNGSNGMRSVAVSRTPNDGLCAGITQHGDLRMNRIVTPGSGRKHTSTELNGAQPLTVIVSNFDNQTAANYQISYRVNNGVWISNQYNFPINPVGNRQFVLGNLNLNNVGSYTITVAVNNLALTDPFTNNDTISVTVKQIDNPALNLSGGYFEGFENTGSGVTVLGKNELGITNLDAWDFTATGTHGRFRSYVNSGITLEGSRSASLDNSINQRYNIAGSSYNTLTGTFNLSNYNTATAEIRCEFDYLLHGAPKFDTGNALWVRGSDQDIWVPMLQYQIDTTNMGVVYNSGSISLTDILTANGQQFSGSTQIRFTQYDTSQIEALYYGNGFTFDNFQLYTVTNDVNLISCESIGNNNCGLGNSTPVTIKVGNGVNNTLYNVAVSYQLDNLPVVTEYVDSIQGKDTILYTFNQTVDLAPSNLYNLSLWVYEPTDTYRINDSIINLQVKNQPVITNYPYLQNFEEGEGDFYAAGRNNSWAFGTPSSEGLNHAASGANAWKTNLSGNHNGNEFSFLYSPCFNIGNLSKPMLSFHIATDIEESANNVYDLAYVEYSYDGKLWQRLGDTTQGTNWYNNGLANAWAKRNNNYWQVASIALPKDNDVISFRVVFRSDQGAEFDGIAIDDIHIYDLVNPIFDGEQFANPLIRNNTSAQQQLDFVGNNQIAGSLISGNAPIGAIELQSYGHTHFINPDSTQYYLPRNFALYTAATIADSTTIRLYVTDTAMKIIRQDGTCPSCSRVSEVQDLGVTIYDDAERSRENNTLADNQSGTYRFIPADRISWVPYDKGYYAEFKTSTLAEFWFNNGGPTKDKTINEPLFNFTANHLGIKNALLRWSCNIDEAVSSYELQRTDSNWNFVTVAQFDALGSNGTNYEYIDTPQLYASVNYYRVKYFVDSTAQYSVARKLDWSNNEPLIELYPNPVNNGSFTLEWFKGTDSELKWSFHSVSGQKILEGSSQGNTFDGKAFFDLSSYHLSPGIYLLKVASGSYRQSFKVVFLK